MNHSPEGRNTFLLCCIITRVTADELTNCVPVLPAQRCLCCAYLALTARIALFCSMLQSELDSIRAELAQLRQSIGKNRDHSAHEGDRGMAHGNGANVGNNNAMPGGNMV